MKAGKYVDAVVGWALGALRGPQNEKEREKARALLDKQEHAPLALLMKRFGLGAVERRLLELLWAAERSLAVSREAGERGITVEVAREALGEPIESLLTANAPLARAALVLVDEPWVSARAGLALGPFLAARLDGEAASLDGIVSGVRAAASLDKWAEQFPGSVRVAEVAKDIGSHEALLVTVDGCARRDALALGVQVARKFSRGLIAVDGEALAGSREVPTVLRALRREADLDALVLLLHQSAALGEAWRALVSPPPAQPQRAPLVLVTDTARTREVSFVDGLRHQHATVNAVAAAGTNEAAAASAQAAQRPAEEDAFEQIRKQAARDAEKAMGIYRPTQEKLPIPPPGKPIASVAAAPAPPAPAAAPPAPAPVAAPVEAPKAEAKSEEKAKPAEKPKKPKRSKKAMEMFGPDPDDVEAAPAPAAPPPAAPAPAPAAAPTESNAPYLQLGNEPSVEALANAARTAPNPRQRVEIMTALRGLKHAAVVAMLRDNAKSEHPEVREAAEQSMQAIFGPNWNRMRAVQKPVQPPVSDDKDRGPPGGW